MIFFAYIVTVFVFTGGNEIWQKILFSCWGETLSVLAVRNNAIWFVILPQPSKYAPDKLHGWQWNAQLAAIFLIHVDDSKMSPVTNVYVSTRRTANSFSWCASFLFFAKHINSNHSLAKPKFCRVIDWQFIADTFKINLKRILFKYLLPYDANCFPPHIVCVFITGKCCHRSL